MVGEPPKIASLGENGQRVDRPDPRNHTQQLIVTVLVEQGMGGSLDLIALPDQAASLCDDHAEHGDRHGAFIDRECDGCAGGLVNIVD